MKITIKNLGALEQAEFELGDLTIICGGNNTGKTYATYALYGFLYYWRELFSLKIPEVKVSQLLSDGVTTLNITDFTKQASSIVEEGCKLYAKQLPRVFAAKEDRFAKSTFMVSLDAQDIQPADKFERNIGAAKADLFSIEKKSGSEEVTISLLVEREKVSRIPLMLLRRSINDAVNEIIFAHLFPNPFIASAERTGAAIFRKELNFARNRLLEEISQSDKDIDPRDLLYKVYKDYALPVRENVDFTRQLETLAKKSSFITQEYPELLEDFKNIIGGEYKVTSHDELYYIPQGKRIRLTMDESSSAVRSLLDVGFYLRHVAQHGDLLMVDEPELNLHPENQRRVARLFARLVNLGVKVFITTHSDYIIKELNTLLMLNQDKPYLKQIAVREKYKPEELLLAEKIRVYIAEISSVKIEGNQRRTKCQTLTKADISQEFGVEASSFDTTIEEMNRIQEEIIWGDE